MTLSLHTHLATRTPGTAFRTTHSMPRAASKKKKPSTLRVTRPYAPRARNVEIHRNGERLGSSTTHVDSTAASSETLGMLLSQESQPSESDNAFSEYIADQTDMQYDDPAGANAEEGEKSNQRKRTTGEAMEEWLTYRETYLHEILRHDGREGRQEICCTDCGERGNYSCYDCAYSMHHCQECLVTRHRLMPLHRIRVCNLSYQYSDN